jgi:hypothetical protein
MGAVFPRRWSGAGRRSVPSEGPDGPAEAWGFVVDRPAKRKVRDGPFATRKGAGGTAGRFRFAARSLGHRMDGPPVAALCGEKLGGLARNRTGVQGFAVLCVTTPPRGLCRTARRIGPSRRPPSGRPARGERSLAEARARGQRPFRTIWAKRMRISGGASRRRRERAVAGPHAQGAAKKYDGFVKSLARTPLRPGEVLCRPPIAVPDSSVGRASDC